MMTRLHLPSLGARDRRALRLGAWIMVPLLFATLVVRPGVGALFEHRAAVQRDRALLARELRLVAESPRERQMLRAAERALSGSGPRLFAGAEPVSASAELARYVSREAKASGLTIEQSETETVLDTVAGSATAAGAAFAPGENAGGNRPLRISIRASGDIIAVTTFLARLEHGAKLVRVEQITIVAGDSTSDDGSLSLGATLSGFARRDFVIGDSEMAAPAASVHGRLVARTEP